MLQLQTFSLHNFPYGLTYGRVAGLSMIFCGLFGAGRYIQRLVKSLRGAVERGSSEISALRQELVDVKSDIREKEGALAGLRKELEEWNRRLEEKEKRLKEVQHDNQALGAQIGHQDRELRRRKEELQQYAREHSDTVQLLEARTLELKAAEAFLTKADALSGADVITLVNTLNSEIYQTAAMVAEAFEFKTRLECGENGIEDADGLADVYVSATDTVGPRMVEMLRSSEHREDPTVIQIALQAGMSAYSNWIIRSWNLEDPEGELGLNKIYKGIRDVEEQAVSGRWRALTRKYLHGTAEHELSLLYIDAFTNILLVAGVAQPLSDLQKSIETRFTERIAVLVRGAQKLRKAIGEEITSCDFEVVFVNHDAPFSPAHMDDAFAGGYEKGRDEPERVLCITELGLEKFERRPGKEGGWENTLLVRPKIALKSGIEEMVASTNDTP